MTKELVDFLLAAGELEDGEPRKLRPNVDEYDVCCDCGLVHLVKVSRSVTIRLTVERELTGMLRRKRSGKLRKK